MTNNKMTENKMMAPSVIISNKIVWPNATEMAKYFTYYTKNVGDGKKYLCLQDHDDEEDEKPVIRLILKPDDPRRDKLLVERCNKHYNDILCQSLQKGIDITTIASDKYHYYGEDIIGNPGYLFATQHDNCQGWLHNSNRCHCGQKVYLNTDNVDFSDLSIFNLDSTIPLGEIRGIGY